VKKQVSLTPVLAVGLVILLATAYFVLVRPKSSEAASLDEEIATLRSQASVASREPGTKAPPKVEIDVADLFRLAKALPDRSDMAAIMLELNAIASSSGVTFQSIAPGEAVVFGDYSALPINLTFQGNYYDLTDFLYRLRNLVTVKEGVLTAQGRLYTLDALDMHEAPQAHFPDIEAVLTLSAYSYGAAPATSGGTPSTSTDTTGTTSTTDTTATTGTTTTDTNDAQAAGAGG
jgi:Tfp pilus assembly protein PilO